MPEGPRLVFGARGASDRLPEWANEGVFIIEWLRERGLWTEAAERLKIQREGGYAGIDALMFLTYFFGAAQHLGIKEFGDRAREHHKQLAAVGDRHWLPTQSSMSRILAAAETEPVREFGSWLLLQVPDIVSVLQHPSVLTRDAVGEGWHVFDWDPTVTTLRHRALPVFEGMPAGRRRSACLAAPGYPGRKRGDVQFSRATLQHAGSGLWLGIEIGPGNGAAREAFQHAVEQVVATCKYAGLPQERAVLRMDGASGNVPALTACTKARVHFVTRLAHYQLLQDRDIVRRLNEAAWFEVPDSGSGPKRQAAELGRVTLEPAPASLQADGSVFAPIETRVVVSRFACSDEGRGAGVTIDSWHYELYGTDLSPVSWPEVEVVAGYYGRSGQENRFHQEDRELGLDRIFSYNLAGQQLATLVGLFVWNFGTCRGMDLARPPEQLPDQATAAGVPLSETPTLPECKTPLLAAIETPEGAPGVGASECGSAAGMAAVASSAPPAAPTMTPSVQTSPPGRVMGNDLFETMDGVDWKRVLEKHDGWSWVKDAGGLRCPGAALLPLVRVEQVKGTPVRARFQAIVGTCDLCTHRSACVRSDDAHYRKDVRLPIPPPADQVLRALWLSTRGTVQVASQRRTSWGPNRPSRSGAIWRTMPLRCRPPDLPHERPPLAVAPPILLPAALRKVIRSALDGMRIEVVVTSGLAIAKPCPVLALTVSERQKRRLTWAERLRWNQLPSGARVEIRLLGAERLRPLLEPVTSVAKSA